MYESMKNKADKKSQSAGSDKWDNNGTKSTAILEAEKIGELFQIKCVARCLRRATGPKYTVL